MKIFKKKFTIFSLLLLAFFTSSCDDDTNTTIDNQETARVQVRLIDGPGDFEEVNVEIIDILINQEEGDGEDDDSGFVSISNGNTGIVNLLELTGGNSLLLADAEVPAGEINQIRLLLGDNNFVVADSEERELSTPSAQQSGLKLQVNETLEAGVTYNFTLDFDVNRSIIEAGNSGRLNLRPVLRVITEAVSGAIEGNVSPEGFQVMVETSVDGETISTFTNEEGFFTLAGIPEGVYELTLTPDEASGFSPVSVENVEVTNGQITNIGTVNFE